MYIKRWKEILFLTALVFTVIACTEDEKEEHVASDVPLLPNKELRGVWMATVWGIDWPNSHTVEEQKQQYINYLDFFQKHHINAVFVQVRGMGDAFYESPYEPWSQTLTGIAGKDPGYDVLRFMIDEAHRRGLAFHAWINPYRIATRSSATASFPALDAKIPHSMVKDYSKIRIYNPALPEVQARIVDIVKDMITKYDVDGIHMDDYFYPEIGNESMNDAAEYEKYGKEHFSDIADFRRDNVNKVVKSLHDVIRSTRPEVAFSISPAANNQTNYNKLFADVVKWTQEGWTDIIIPQLYFPTGSGANSFNQLLHWWSQFTYQSTLMVGYGIYKFGDSAQGAAYQTSEDLEKQFAHATRYHKVKGSVLYSAKNLLQNKANIMDVIQKAYAHPAVLPYVGKDEPVLPMAPSGLRINGSQLQWNAVSGAYYAVYRSNGTGNVATVVSVTRDPFVSLLEKGTYFVTAIDANNHAESATSEMIVY